MFESRTFRNLKESFKSSRKARKILLEITYEEITYEEDALEGIKSSLSHLIEEKPAEVYAIAVELLRGHRESLPKIITEGVEEIARSAARKSLCFPLIFGGKTDEMDNGRFEYPQLFYYHFRCKHRLVGILWTESFLKSAGTERFWYNIRCGVCPPAFKDDFVVPHVREVLGITEYPPKWWAEYWTKVVTSVKDDHCWGPLENGSIRNDTLQALARVCPTCYDAAAKGLPLFEDKVLSVINKVIDGVRIFVDRCLPRD